MLSAKSLIQQILTQVCNQGDLAAVNELIVTEDSIRTASGEEPVSRMGLRHLLATFRTAFPDLHCTVEDEISMGDKVAAYWTMRGTHLGPFLGNRATGRPIVAQGLILARIDNGRITEERTLVDQMGILQQLGLIPPAGIK
ncbi:MAG: ester cyclase [Caldilineaceae bacterium]